MFSASSKIMTVAVALISVLAFASIYIDTSAAEETDYQFYLMNTVDGEDSTINGWYSASGNTVVEAFVKALDNAKIPYTGFTGSDSYIPFGGTKTISDWTQGAWVSDGSYYGANFAIWNYNPEDGWHLGDYFGNECGKYQPAHKSSAKDTAFIISHEKYVDVNGPVAPTLGIYSDGVWADTDEYDIVYDGTTGGYSGATQAAAAWYIETYMMGDASKYGLSLAEDSEDYEDIDEALLFWFMEADMTAYSAVPGWDISNAQYGYAQLAPVDLKATPEKVQFGLNNYTIILDNTVEGDDSTINGTYTAKGANPVIGLYNALHNAKIPNTIDPTQASIWFAGGTISDWTYGWDTTAEEIVGPNYAVWNYSEEKGWFTGNSFGKDSETTYYISHENYLSSFGDMAFLLGVTYDEDFNFNAPAGISTAMAAYGAVQTAPRDLKATPDKVVFGPEVNEYNIYLVNFVEGQDSDFNGWYTGYGSTPVQALVQILNLMEIKHKIDYNAESVFFKTGDIADWTSAWDSSAADNLGANYAVWNYSEEKGWFTGNTFGKDPETTYLLVHENYYVPSGETAAKLGVKVTAEGITCPAGLADGWGMYVHYAPIDLKAEPSEVVIGKIAGIDYLASIEADGKITYYETLAAANAATIGTAFKVIGNVELPATLSLKKDMEVVSGVLVKVAKQLTVAKNMTLTIDEGAAVHLTGAAISNSGTIDIKGELWTSTKNINGTSGVIKGTVTVLPYYAVGDTGAFSAGAGTTVHNKTSDKGTYLAGAEVALTYEITSVSLDGAGSWSNCGTATITGITFKENPSIVYVPSYIISKITIGSDVVYYYYKVNAISDETVKAINEKTLRVFLPAELQSQKFGETVDVSNMTYYTDEDGNKVYYHVDETSPVWMSGYTTYTMYTKAEQPDAKFCEQGTVVGVQFAEGMTTYGKKTVKWAINDAITSDEYVSGKGFADITVGVMVADNTKSYTFILNNSVEGEDSTINGTYTALGDTPVRALAMALGAAGIDNTVDANAPSIWFSTNTISNWTSAWDSSAEDCLGANYAVWNYSEEKGWFTGNTFGTDAETVYYISHENYYVPTGTTAASLGISKNLAGEFFAPVGEAVQYGMYVQTAPRDAKAAPADVVFGVDKSALVTYTFVLKNSVGGENSRINGLYTGVGMNAVQALVTALNNAEIAHNIDFGADSVWFSTNTIADWTSAWESTAEECYGANYAVWNYDPATGWFTGNTFGKDPETAYLISHENYYVAGGKISEAMGITYVDGHYCAPEGLTVSWDMYIQLEPLNPKAAPADVVLEPRYVIAADPDNGSDVIYIAQKEGTAVTAPVVTKKGYEFIAWDPEFPAAMPAMNTEFKAVWGTVPIIVDNTIEYELKDGDSTFKVPTDTHGMAVEVDMGDKSVVVKNGAALAGKTVVSKVDAAVNPTKVNGTAYEFTFEADGTPYTGAMQVTLPYQSASGKVPVVYFVDGDKLVSMEVISYENGLVTFETNHNSMYLVANEVEGVSTLTIVGTVAVAVACILAAIVAVVAGRKQVA